MVAGTQYNNRIIHSDIQPELCGSRLTRHMEQPPRADHLHYRRIRTVTEGPESQQQSNHGAGTETTRAKAGNSHQLATHCPQRLGLHLDVHRERPSTTTAALHRQGRGLILPLRPHPHPGGHPHNLPLPNPGGPAEETDYVEDEAHSRICAPNELQLDVNEYEDGVMMFFSYLFDYVYLT